MAGDGRRFAGGAVPDRQIRVRSSAPAIGASDGADDDRRAVVHASKRGASSASPTLLVPQYEDWQVCGWNVWVDGSSDDELSREERRHRAATG